MQFQVGLYDAPEGSLIADHSYRIEKLAWSTDLHGDRDCFYEAAVGLREAMELIDQTNSMYLQVNRGAENVWAGRVDTTALQINGGDAVLRIEALGPRAALSDGRYSALWSDTRVAEWRPQHTGVGLPPTPPEKYNMDFNNRLYISLKKNQTYAQNSDIGAVYYLGPDDGARGIQRFSFTYSIRLPAGWNVSVNSWSYDPVTDTPTYAGSTPWSLTATGGLQTGTVSAVFTGNPIGINFMIYNTNPNFTNPNEDNFWFARLTGVRVTTVAATSIFGSDIVASVLATVSSENPDQIVASAHSLQNPNLDMLDALFEDVTPAEVFQWIADIGDGTQRWEWGVARDRIAYLRPPGEVVNAWQIEVSELDLERSISDLYNRVYATYTQINDRILRTPVAEDLESINATGLKRGLHVSSDGDTSETLAARLRDAALAESSQPRPRMQVQPIRVTRAGTQVRNYDVRAGDRCTIPNLPIIGSATFERLRSFRVSETSYDGMTDTLTIVPELPTAQLEYLLSGYNFFYDFSGQRPTAYRSRR